MNLALALHTAARRFCADQHHRWSGQYMRLSDSEARGGQDYSNVAYSLFPRYRLNEAIRVEVEKIVGSERRSVDEAREMLLEAGHRAHYSLAEEFHRSPEACCALSEELKAFEHYMHGITALELATVEPLPYRRVLREDEGKRLRQKLRDRWGVAGYWYPLSKCDPDVNVIAFHQEMWARRQGTVLLSRAIEDRGIDHCFLLLEGPHDYEIDRNLLDTVYKGDESFVTSDFEWLLYSSHESSVAIAGWLADWFRAEWPDWNELSYQGPFHTADLRGTWDRSDV